jgi:methylated-DNA-[protein]-cysteine S-methyltransferase
MDVAYAPLDSPVGPLVVAATRRGLVRISYVYEDPEFVVEDLAARISPRVLEAPERLDDVRRELDEYFDGTRTDFDIAIDWRLTAGFTRKVLRATARVPYGSTSTYREVAGKAGSPRGSRAAGNALGSNPIPIVVPCHRILHSGGGMGGYTGGLDKKIYLLNLEGAI